MSSRGDNNAPQPPDRTPRAAYIHVPFCLHRCGYCDFTLVADRNDLIGEYLSALDREMDSLESCHELDSLFLGGGTPTHFDPDQLAELFEIIMRRFRLADSAEVSIEANPDGFTSDKVDVLASAGVNRVSLGAQSFDASVLRTLERQHTPEEIGAVVDRVRVRIANVSLDLIFGVPGQTLSSWQATLDAAVDLNPNHVSTYGLTFEKGTAFWSRRERGELIPVHSEIERAMYGLAIDRLAAASFEHYEISNFARASFQCRHNATYWAGEPWFAFGPGAARFINGRRETNHRSVFTWLKCLQEGRSVVGDTEEMTLEERAREVIVLGLRRTAGVARADVEFRFGLSIDDLASDAIERHVRLGNLVDDKQRIRLTDEGRYVADSVVVDFL